MILVVGVTTRVTLLGAWPDEQAANMFISVLGDGPGGSRSTSVDGPGRSRSTRAISSIPAGWDDVNLCNEGINTGVIKVIPLY